jgi:hypothetical protein
MIDTTSTSPDSQKQNNWSILDSILDWFGAIYNKAAKTVMRFLGGIDETFLTPVRDIIVFVRTWALDESAIFRFLWSYPIIFLPALIFPFVYALIFRKQEERDYNLTCPFKLLQKVMIANGLDKNSEKELKKSLVGNLISAAEELDPNITNNNIAVKLTEDGQIRLVKSGSLGKTEPEQRTGFWQRVKDFYDKHEFLGEICRRLLDYSMFYWVLWFSVCIYTGAIISLTSWWILGGALVGCGVLALASWGIKKLGDYIKDKNSLGLTLDSYLETDNCKAQEDKKFTEKVIARYFLDQYFNNLSRVTTKAPENSQSTFEYPSDLGDRLQSSIQKSINFLNKKHEVYKYVIASLYGLNGWVLVCFSLWPVTDLILLVGSYFAINLALTSLILTTVIASIGLAVGIFYFMWELNKCQDDLNRNHRLAEYATGKLAEKGNEIKALNIHTANQNYNFTQTGRLDKLTKFIESIATHNDCFDDFSRTLHTDPETTGSKFERFVSRLGEGSQKFLGCLGTGIAQIRFLLLPGTIGAIICYGFAIGSDGLYKALTLFACGGLFGLSPLATIGIIALITGIIWATIKIYELRFERNSARAERLVNNIDNRVYAVGRGLEIIKGDVQSQVSALAAVQSDNPTNHQQSAGFWVCISSFFGCGSNEIQSIDPKDASLNSDPLVNLPSTR